MSPWWFQRSRGLPGHSMKIVYTPAAKKIFREFFKVFARFYIQICFLVHYFFTFG
ncbi:unnamed protein product [Meloidogyne enterolobii]|uniref:Uncharacterized protein n=1 Tax=Meloidogyne enterolobii TaxID=390850 RepID=A0ACB0YST0_MELEN